MVCKSPLINSRETRVNMADIERIAMVLSKSSKTVADWKLKFPILQDTMKTKLASEMEKVNDCSRLSKKKIFLICSYLK